MMPEVIVIGAAAAFALTAWVIVRLCYWFTPPETHDV